MKKRKILFITLLSTILCVTPVFAEDEQNEQNNVITYNGVEIPEDNIVDSVITGSFASAYTIEVPKNIVLTNTGTAEYSIIVSGELIPGYTLYVEPIDNDAKKKGINVTIHHSRGEEEAEEIGGLITQEITSWDSETLPKEPTEYKGTIQLEKSLKAGTYSGKISYSIRLEEPKDANN